VKFMFNLINPGGLGCLQNRKKNLLPNVVIVHRIKRMEFLYRYPVLG